MVEGFPGESNHEIKQFTKHNHSNTYTERTSKQLNQTLGSPTAAIKSPHSGYSHGNHSRKMVSIDGGYTDASQKYINLTSDDDHMANHQKLLYNDGSQTVTGDINFNSLFFTKKTKKQ